MIDLVRMFVGRLISGEAKNQVVPIQLKLLDHKCLELEIECMSYNPALYK